MFIVYVALIFAATNSNARSVLGKYPFFHMCVLFVLRVFVDLSLGTS